MSAGRKPRSAVQRCATIGRVATARIRLARTAQRPHDWPKVAPFAPVRAGDVLLGKYRVERVLGEGGMGVVVEATHVALNERVAIKFLRPALALQAEAMQRFVREARVSVRIKSPHVARVSDIGTLETGAPFIVMEFLHGQDASALLNAQGPMPAEAAIEIVVQACDALAEAHAQGIVHRDVKPANLFVSRHADGSSFVKVLDFGISKLSDTEDAHRLTRTTAALGSAAYMSPEQMRQSRSVDHRTDIYALGVTLFELLSATLPFDAESFAALCVEVATGAPKRLATLRPDLSPELIRVVERAFCREPAERFQNVGELALALAPWGPSSIAPVVERIARLTGASPPQMSAEVDKAPAVIASPQVARAVSTSRQLAHSTRARFTTSMGIAFIAGTALGVAFLVVVVVVITASGRETEQAPEPPAAFAAGPQPSFANVAPTAATSRPPVALASVAAAPPPATSAPPHRQRPIAKTSLPARPEPPSARPPNPEIDLNER